VTSIYRDRTQDASGALPNLAVLDQGGAASGDAPRPPLIIQAHPATQPGNPRAVFLGASLSRSLPSRLGRPFGVACGRLRRIPGRRSPGSLRLRGRRGKV